MDLDFCKGESNVKLRFLCVGGFTCSVQNTFRNVKHEASRGVWEHAPPENFLKNACSEIESGAFLGTKLLC